MTAVQTAAEHSARLPAVPLLLLIIGIPALVAAWLTIDGLMRLLPPERWLAALSATNLTDPSELLYRHAFLPRLAVTLLAGAALGLCGTLLQQVLRNPLAEPTTIGTNAGASLALTVATLYAPWMLETGSEWVALGGGALTTLFVFALARSRSFSPLSIIIAGLIVSLTCSSASTLLMAINREYSEELFIWQSGSLVQNGDAVVLALIPWLAAAAVVAFLLVRPLRLLDLGDDGAASLGARPAMIRFAGLAVAVALGATVVAAVGVISFVALAAPALVRLAGVRTLASRMIAAPVAGAVLLWLTDRLVQVAPFASELPAGTATALIGAPLLFLLLPSLRAVPDQGDATAENTRRRGWPALFVGLAVLTVAVAVALAFGRGAGGWQWLSTFELAELLPLRAPRVAVALAAGVMLALAGTLMQRMTGNPLAAPEVLGVSGGATLGVLLLFLVTVSFDRATMFAAAIAGAQAALVTVVLVSSRNMLAPDRLLLAGVAVATMASALASVFLASGDPRLDFLLSWLSGSTYRATVTDAVVAVATALATLALVPLTARWLEILPLGEAVSRGLGVGLGRVRAVLLVLIAIPTAVSTLVIGPLSFVGLMAPHMARMLGFSRPLPQLMASAILGGLILVTADWAGRNLIFPWQVPAGLLAAFIGGPYFLISMWRQPRA
jgi:ABC-type Fe3+-siderophore transport system permease subunit